MGGSGRKELVTQVQEGLQIHHQFPMAGLGGSLTNWSGVSVAPDDHVRRPNETVVTGMSRGMNRGNTCDRPHGPR